MFRRRRHASSVEETQELPAVLADDEDEDDGTEPAEERFRTCCKRIHQAFLDTQDGVLAPELFRAKKVNLLRTAVHDARARGAGPELVRMVSTLRLACAVNDVELQSVTDYFAASDT